MFDHPDLVAHLVPYLTPKDMARCIAACKTFATIFEPYLYREVNMIYKDPIIPALPRHLQHVRILGIYGQYSDCCLEDLVGQMKSTESELTVPTAAVTLKGMTNLQKLTFNITCSSTWTYEQIILDTIINTLDNNNGLTHLELQMYTDLPESSIDPRLLDPLRTGLPRLQRFIVSGGRAFTIVQAMEALKICFGHPSLTDVQFYTDAERHQNSQTTDPIDQTHFDSLLEFLNGLDRASQQFQRANGCRLKSLVLPYIEGGYPRSFLLPLLRTYLPQLERFEIPAMDGPYESELEEVIAGHCRNLQHVSYTFPLSGRRQNSSVIKAVIRGCARWNGLKSIRIYGYFRALDTDSGLGLVETLMEYHSKTLESVEFVSCWGERTFLLDPIFTGCPNLKSFKLVPVNELDLNWNWWFVRIPADPWIFQELKELHLHFAQKYRYSSDIDTARQELAVGEQIFKQIGMLIHLEILALGFGNHSSCGTHEWGFDDSIEARWVKEFAGLDKLRYLYMPYECWGEKHLSGIIDSSWPQLERVSSRDLKLADRAWNDRFFGWLKVRRPWLKIGDFQ